MSLKMRDVEALCQVARSISADLEDKPESIPFRRELSESICALAAATNWQGWESKACALLNAMAAALSRGDHFWANHTAHAECALGARVRSKRRYAHQHGTIVKFDESSTYQWLVKWDDGEEWCRDGELREPGAKP